MRSAKRRDEAANAGLAALIQSATIAAAFVIRPFTLLLANQHRGFVDILAPDLERLQASDTPLFLEVRCDARVDLLEGERAVGKQREDPLRTVRVVENDAALEDVCARRRDLEAGARHIGIKR